jgi:predicted heme/steroid binding protein
MPVSDNGDQARAALGRDDDREEAMTLKELAAGDGREGRRAWVAVNGKVYDFTDSPLWAGGDHQGVHRAGCDLTEALQTAPHVRAVIERFPVVGELTVEAAPAVPGPTKTRLLAFLAAAMAAGVLFWLLAR